MHITLITNVSFIKRGTIVSWYLWCFFPSSTYRLLWLFFLFCFFFVLWVTTTLLKVQLIPTGLLKPNVCKRKRCLFLKIVHTGKKTGIPVHLVFLRSSILAPDFCTPITIAGLWLGIKNHSNDSCTSILFMLSWKTTKQLYMYLSAKGSAELFRIIQDYSQTNWSNASEGKNRSP